MPLGNVPGDRWLQLVGLALLFVLSFVIYQYVGSGTFDVCAVAEFKEEQKKTIASLDAIVDLSLKLSTTLVGFGAAALIGLKSGLKLSSLVRFSIVVATIFFAESALYAIWWRLGIAEVFYNECFKLISSPRLQLRFSWHLYFFTLGLFAMTVIVLEVLFRPREKEMDT
jgi:hypothetical protein